MPYWREKREEIPQIKYWRENCDFISWSSNSNPVRGEGTCEGLKLGLHFYLNKKRRLKVEGGIDSRY